MREENPFGSEHRENILKLLLNQGLVKRITIIEGRHPTSQEQKDFLKRIIEWMDRSRHA